MGDAMWPLFWVALAAVLTGGAAYSSTMMMRIIDGRIDKARRQIMDELDRVEGRLTRVEGRVLEGGAGDDGPRLAGPSAGSTNQD